MEKATEEEIRCPIAPAVDLFSGRWKTSILWHIAEAPKRFNEIHRLVPQISSRMLAKTLRELERDGLISRQVTAKSPVKVFYSKTDLSESLRSIFERIDAWQKAHMKSVRDARDNYDREVA